MDSPNPYIQRSTFMDLLSSQQETQYPQDIPYGSFPQTMPIGSSEIPVFSTQWSDDEGTAEERKQRKRWTPSEDLVLISTWLNTSKDAVVSNEQKSAKFWHRIAALYAESPKIAAGAERPYNQCKQKWRKISEEVSKFCGAYRAALIQKKSSYAPKDYLNMAHDIFFIDYKAKFTLEHEWNALKTEQKWCSLSSTNHEGQGEGSSKRRKTAEGPAQSGSFQSITNDSDETMVRPPGIKATKAMLKRPVTKASNEEEEKKLLKYQRMWEIKEKDYDRMEKLSDQKARLSDRKMLENLLAKTEPLTDLEILLKNKLINDMLS